MFLGKVNAALKLLSNEGSSGLVMISEEVLSTLHEKHPEAQPMFEDLLLQGPVCKIHPATFQAIDGDLIQTITRLLAPLTDSILVEAAHQPQFPCPKVSLKTG